MFTQASASKKRLFSTPADCVDQKTKQKENQQTHCRQYKNKIIFSGNAQTQTHKNRMPITFSS